MKKLTDKCKLAIGMAIATIANHDRPTLAEPVFDHLVNTLEERHLTYINSHNTKNAANPMDKINLQSLDRMMQIEIKLQYEKELSTSHFPRMHFFPGGFAATTRSQPDSIAEATEYLNLMSEFYNHVK